MIQCQSMVLYSQYLGKELGKTQQIAINRDLHFESKNKLEQTQMNIDISTHIVSHTQIDGIVPEYLTLLEATLIGHNSPAIDDRLR